MVVIVTRRDFKSGLPYTEFRECNTKINALSYIGDVFCDYVLDTIINIEFKGEYNAS